MLTFGIFFFFSFIEHLENLDEGILYIILVLFYTSLKLLKKKKNNLRTHPIHLRE